MNAPASFEPFLLADGEKKYAPLTQWIKLLDRISFEKDTQVPNAAIFTLNREDHTVGNMLTCQLLKDPRVLFAGYKAPHPLEHKIVIRVQTLPPTTPLDVFISALKDLVSEVSNIEEQFRKVSANIIPISDSQANCQARRTDQQSPDQQPINSPELPIFQRITKQIVVAQVLFHPKEE
ncbi:DNA-directed RNA polymerase II subunit RPB11-a [Clonorchis sinensis]|uniref:DNA-directed RNA polymerase II subunit RPB11 n=2 Tax=Clonorchis sinensis TaxID=79923 RepID=G7YEZ3_CLOSI|nr:DNA-directed RNA polymerase II subunit RPB11-a [Clonorchis sinensis]GAA51526.1 DNA-directed RNA polymerase II subunit RPB11 [Clonorchis sinensis]